MWYVNLALFLAGIRDVFVAFTHGLACPLAGLSGGYCLVGAAAIKSNDAPETLTGLGYSNDRYALTSG